MPKIRLFNFFHFFLIQNKIHILKYNGTVCRHEPPLNLTCISCDQDFWQTSYRQILNLNLSSQELRELSSILLWSWSRTPDSSEVRIKSRLGIQQAVDCMYNVFGTCSSLSHFICDDLFVLIKHNNGRNCFRFFWLQERQKEMDLSIFTSRFKVETFLCTGWCWIQYECL